MASITSREEVPAFLFATCLLGAEHALKAEVAREHPGFRFAYSRPGFLTFKFPTDFAPAPNFDLKSVFARTWGFSLGKVDATSPEEAFAAVASCLGSGAYKALHVWQRDIAAMGYRGFEPHRTAAAIAAEEGIRRHLETGTLIEAPAAVAQPGDFVLDCLLVEPHEWWLGQHWAVDGEACYPGGLRDFDSPPQMISRAYLKMREALAWSDLQIRPGETFAEIGCAPGGASQALLESGLNVMGIDPAEVDPIVVAHPHFTHIRKRGADVRRREFRGVHWLAADMNVAPQYTLDTVEGIVSHEAVQIRGLLLTLKLLDWQLAAEIPQYLARVKSWGYHRVRARQLPHNRQEICVTALRRRARR